VLGNYSYDSDFGNFISHASHTPPRQKSKMIFQIELLAATRQIILCHDSPTGVTNKEVEIEKRTRHEEVRTSPSQI